MKSTKKLLEGRGVPREVLEYRGAVRDRSGTEHAREDCPSREGRASWRSTGTLGACECAGRESLGTRWGSVAELKSLGRVAEDLEDHRNAKGVLERARTALTVTGGLHRAELVEETTWGTKPPLHTLAASLVVEGVEAYEETFAPLRTAGTPERTEALRALDLTDEGTLLVEIRSRAGSLSHSERTTSAVTGRVALELYRVAERDGAVLVSAPGAALELLYSLTTETTYSREPLLSLTTTPGVGPEALETLLVLYPESSVDLAELVETAEALSR